MGLPWVDSFFFVYLSPLEKVLRSTIKTKKMLFVLFCAHFFVPLHAVI